jgi:hypothetical protein
LQPGTLFLISQLLQQGALGYSRPKQQLSANSLLRQLLPKVSPELPQKGISDTEAQQQGPVGAVKWWCRTVLRIRIRMFFGLPDPDPFVRSTDPAPTPDPSIINKNNKKNLDS